MERLCREDDTATEVVLKDVCRRATEPGIMAVVSLTALSAIPVRLRTQFIVAKSVSHVTWQRIRGLIGGSQSGLASTPVMRADGLAAYAEERNLVQPSTGGATLVSFRAAFDALLEDLLARNQSI